MTAQASPRLGKNSVLYRNTGSYGTPTWTPLTNCKDVKAPQSYAEDDVSARITQGFEATVTTLQKVGVSFTMFDDDGVDITAIRTAYNGQTTIEVAVMNGLMSDSAARGFRGFFQVKKFDEGQGNDKAVAHEVELGLTWPTVVDAPSAAPLSGSD